jgi:hypothetical protein
MQPVALINPHFPGDPCAPNLIAGMTGVAGVADLIELFCESSYVVRGSESH